LQKNFNSSKKITELGDELRKRYGCTYGEYLKECYDNRTIFVHPKNIHLAHWCPPLCADDCFETIEVVRDLLNIYLLDEFTEFEIFN
jgi:hypothetical protein